MSKTPLSILYVDDEPLLLRLTREYLEGLGIVVDIAESGSEALEKIASGTYDAVISDYQMPRMNGIELLHKIRAGYPELPFILFTGRGREEVVIEAIDSGADFYVQKGGRPAPQFRELIHKIQVAVKRRSDEKALRESELRFRSLIQNSSDIIRILDPDGIIRYESPSSASILGYPEGSLLGKNAFDFIHPEDREQVLSDFSAVHNRCNSGIPTEYRIRRADGSYLYVESVGVNLTGFPGIDGIVTTTHSVEARRKAGMELRTMAGDLSAAYEELEAGRRELAENYDLLARHEAILAGSEERFRGIAERSSDLIITLDAELRVTYASPASRTITGYDPEEFFGKNDEYAASSVFSPSFGDFRRIVETTLKGESVENAVLQLRRKDGTIAWVSLNAVPVIDDRELSGIQVSIRDITAVREAEMALSKSEEKFVRFANNARDVLYRLSLPDMRYEYISPAIGTLTGYLPEEFYADPAIFRRILHPAWESYYQEQVRALRQNILPPSYEYQIIDRSGRTRWCNQRNVLVTGDDGEPIAMEGIVTDVTDQKNAEHELRRSQQRFLITTMNAGVWVWEVDPDGICTYSGPAVEQILGYHPEELTGKAVFDILPAPLESGGPDARLPGIFRSRQSFSSVLFPAVHRDGSRVLLKMSGAPLVDEQGIFTGYCGVCEDITAQKEAEERLIESEARYRLLADHLHDLIWTTDLRMQLTYVSPSVTPLLGFTLEEAYRVGLAQSMTPDSYQKIRDAFHGWTDKPSAGSVLPEKKMLDLELKRQDGSTIWTEVIITPIFAPDASVTGIVGVTRDISLRRRAEGALRTANRQLGLLTSITRHDILNKISVIHAYLGLIEMKGISPEISSSLQGIAGIIDEIQENIEFTRTYQDLGSERPQWFRLSGVMPCTGSPPSVTVTADLDGYLIFADPMLGKVFFNLLDNSIRHGVWTSEIRVSARVSGEDLIIIWEDNGTGVCEAEKERIFEPGYGKNTGFGMFLVRDILSLTGITISENGRPGSGARFEITVPPGSWKEDCTG